MGIIEFANDELELEGFGDNWETFRDMSMKGIFTYPDSEIRNLHASMSMMLSHKRVQLGHREFELERNKMFLEMTKNRLLHQKYNSGTVAANNAAVVEDEEYKTQFDKYLYAKEQFLVFEAETKALETAVMSLSRELTARTK